jgi:hypothetical protein
LHWVLLCPQKRHSTTLLFCNTLLKLGCHFYYWNQPLNMRMRVSYLGCLEAGPCCYLVIHIENVLRPLQMFYFHLWSILTLPLAWRSTVVKLADFDMNISYRIQLTNTSWLGGREWKVLHNDELHL